MRTLLVVAASVPSLALASGLGIPDLGARNFTQGAASFAAPDDPFALYFNPAALVQHGGLGVVVDARFVTHTLKFQRLLDDGTNPDGWPVVESTGPTSIAPAAIVSYRLENKAPVPVAFAIGGFPSTGYSGYQFPDPFAIRAQYGDGVSFDEKAALASPQRYAMVSANSLSYTTAIGFGARVLDWLDLGASFQNPIVHFRSVQAISLDSLANAPREELAFDALLGIDAVSYFNPIVSFAASAEPTQGLHLGLVWQLPGRVNATGKLAVTPSPSLTKLGVKVEGDDATLTVPLPFYLRFGARLVRDLWEAELAVTWDGWSNYDELILQGKGIFVVKDDGSKTEVKEVRLQKRFVDAYSVRAGGLLKLKAVSNALSMFTLRAGVLGETSAVPLERTNLDAAHWERLGFTIGLGVDVGPVQVSCGYALYLQPERIVRDSAVKQSRSAKPEFATTVGNGNYISQPSVLGVSISGRFGEPPTP